MSAIIIPFPKKLPHKVVKSIDLYYCWDPRLKNPLLNSLYKSHVSHVEKWYQQTMHLLNLDQFDHPIIQLLLSPQDNTLNLLLESTNKDLSIQHYFYNSVTIESARYNIGKLIKWQSKWQGLLQFRQVPYTF
jgi:hypothetical protein